MSDLRITDVESHVVARPWKPWVVVVVETSDGTRGMAEDS